MLFILPLFALLILQIFKFLCWLFGDVYIRLGQKDQVNFKIYEVIIWLASNCNTHIARYLKKYRQSDNEIWSVNIEYNMRNPSLKNHTQNIMEKLIPGFFLKNQNWVYLCSYSLKFYIVCFYCMPSWGLLKCIETNLHTTFFYLKLSLFEKQKEV